MTERTLYLDPDTWDLELDDTGNIRVATESYAVAQNVASATRAFTNDMYFQLDRGVPHFETDISNPISTGVLTSRLNRCARAVDGVLTAETTITSFENRVIEGEIRLTTINNEIVTVSL